MEFTRLFLLPSYARSSHSPRPVECPQSTMPPHKIKFGLSGTASESGPHTSIIHPSTAKLMPFPPRMLLALDAAVSCPAAPSACQRLELQLAGPRQAGAMRVKAPQALTPPCIITPSAGFHKKHVKLLPSVPHPSEQNLLDPRTRDCVSAPRGEGETSGLQLAELDTEILASGCFHSCSVLWPEVGNNDP